MFFIGQFPYRGITALCMTVALLVSSSASQLPGSESIGRTYLGGGSYAVYPQWLITDEGLCEFTFATSQLNGSVFYMDGAEGSDDFLYIQLVEGKIAVDIGIGRPQLQLRAHFGENINDNQPHNVKIIHSSKQFEFRLDGTSVATLNYSDTSSPDFRSQVHFGGVPDSHTGLTSVVSDTSFAGCLQSIQFANCSIAPTMLFNREPLLENRVQNGCSDPCLRNSCNGGRCIRQWGTDVGYYCDCRDTLRAGPTCLEDPATYQLTPTAINYFCYTLLPQPYINEPDKATAILVPPLPETGTILSGLSVDQNSSFSIYLRNHRLYIELRAVNTLYELSLQTVLSPAIEYQIQYLQQNTYVEIKILSSSQLIESLNMTLNNSFQMDFRDICVGGGLLEVVNYYGIIEYVFFRHFALAETQRFFPMVISRSDVIQFTNASETPASLSFERYNLRSQRIRFEFRLQPEGTGVLLRSQNDRYQFMMVTLNGELIIINTDLSNQSSVVQCENTSVNDGLWHNISIQKAGGGVGTALGLRITLDNIHVCETNDNSFELGLRSLATTSPLELGVTTDLYIGSSVPYIGCMQNIVFELGTETFRPNLEVKSRVEERFEMARCFFCTSQMSDSLSCQNGGRCSDRGASTDPECACPAEYTGQQCETLVLPSTVIPPQQSTPSTPLPTTTTTIPDDRSKVRGGISAAEIGMWVGIALAGVFGIILIVFIAIVAYLIYRHVVRKQGFYKTNESQGNKVSMLHYSASLRQLSSEAVTLEKNGAVPVPGEKDKEFFL